MVVARPLEGGDVAVALLNTGNFSSPTNISFNFMDVRDRDLVAIL